MFFGLDEEFEETEKLKWLDRRKRLATRKYGELKNEYVNCINEIPTTQISQVLLVFVILYIMYYNICVLMMI